MNALAHELILPIWMSDEEQALLRAFLQCSHRYLEFGAGGSTCLAAQTVSQRVISIDSDQAWLDRVADVCESRTDLKSRPELHHVDIGDTGRHGYPTGSDRSKWSAYHAAPWSELQPFDFDTCLVDGRFRVACFMQALLHCDPQSVILIHDFRDRKPYHVVFDFAHEIARAERLSAFQRRKDFNRAKAEACLARHALDAR